MKNADEIARDLISRAAASPDVLVLAQRLVDIAPALAPKLERGSVVAALCTAGVALAGRDLTKADIASLLRQLADEIERAPGTHLRDLTRCNFRDPA